MLLAKRLGKTRVVAETGAGQHGVATATVCAKFGLGCVIYMGAEDVRRQALIVFRIRMLGGSVISVRSGCRERGAPRLGDQLVHHSLPRWIRHRTSPVSHDGERFSEDHWRGNQNAVA